MTKGYTNQNEKFMTSLYKKSYFGKSEVVDLQYDLLLSYLVMTIEAFYRTVQELQPSKLSEILRPLKHARGYFSEGVEPRGLALPLSTSGHKRTPYASFLQKKGRV